MEYKKMKDVVIGDVIPVMFGGLHHAIVVSVDVSADNVSIGVKMSKRFNHAFTMFSVGVDEGTAYQTKEDFNNFCALYKIDDFIA